MGSSRSAGSAAADVFGAGRWPGVFDDDGAVGVEDEEAVAFFDEADEGAEQGATDLESDAVGKDCAVVADVRHPPSVDCGNKGSLRDRAPSISFRGRGPRLLRGNPSR